MDDFNELDEYVKNQLEQHYGKEVVRNAAKAAPPPPPQKRKPLFSFAAVLCAVVFITGALMLAGVLFTGGIPTKSSENSDTSRTSSDLNEYSSSVSASSEHSSEISSIIEKSDTARTSSDTHEYTSNEQVSSDNESTGFSTASRSDVENSNAVSRRDEPFSLPEETSGSFSIISDPNNNSETNPYDNVTTGRRARAGVGIFLMLSSLGCAAALFNLYNDKENEI